MAIEFRQDPATKNGWGSWDTDLNAFIVTCESCNKVVGQGPTIGDASDDAFDNDAHIDNHPEGSGDTNCRECYDAWQDEAMREAMAYLPQYRAEQALRDRQTREDDMLAQADMIFDRARDNGEI